MRDFFRKFRKVAGYGLLYIIITLGTAFGSLFLLTSAPKIGTSNKVTIAPQINKVYKNLTSKEALHLDIDLALQGQSDIALNLKTDIKNLANVENMELQGNMEIKINGENLPLSFSYQGGSIYLEVCNARFSLVADNISSSLEQILSTFGFSLSSLGLNLEDLSVESVLGMLSNLTETKENGVIILSIDVPVVGKLEVLCDEDYNISSLSLPQTTLDGMTIEVGLNVSYPQSVEIVPPQEEYMDVSSMFEVISSTLDYLTNGNFGMGIEFNKGDLSFSGNLYANLQSLYAQYEMDLLGQNAKLYLLNKALYLELGNLNLKFDLSSLPQALDILNSRFDLNIPTEIISQILASSSGLNLSQLLGSTSLSDLDLSIVESFTQNGNTSSLILKELGQFDFVLNEGKFENFVFTANDMYFKASSIPVKHLGLSFNPDIYVDLAKAVPALDAIISTAEEDYILASGDMNLYGISGSASAAIDMINSRLNVDLSAYGKEIGLDYFGGNAYLKIDNTYLHGTTEEISTLLEKLGFKTDPQSLLDTLKNLLDPQKYASLIKSIDSGENSLTLTLFDDMTITLFYDEQITKIELNWGKIQIALNLTYPQSHTFPTIEEDRFAPASIILDKIANIYDYVKSGEYYFELSGKTAENTIDGFINHSGGQTEANINIASADNIINLIIANQTIYLRVNEDYVAFSAKDFNEALNILTNTVNIDISSLLQKIDINYLVANLLQSASLQIEQDNIAIAYKDLKLSVGFENDIPISIGIEGKDFNGILNIKNSPLQMPSFNAELYKPVTSLIEKASALSNYISSNEHYLTIKATYNDIVIEGALNHQNESLSALLEVKGENPIAKVTIQDSAIYIDYKDLHISCDFQSIKEFINLLTENQDDNLTEILFNIIDNIKFNSTLIDTILSKSKLEFTDDKLTLGFADAICEINFNANNLTSAKLNYSGLEILLSVNSSPAAIERVEDEGYLPLSGFMGKIQSLLTLIESQQLYLDFTAKYSSFDLSGHLNIDSDGISLIANTSIEGEQAQIKLLNKVIYIEKNNLKLQFGLDKLETVKQFLLEEFNLDIFATLNDALNLSITKILESISLRYVDNSLKFSCGDIVGQIDFNEKGLAGLNVKYKDLEVVGVVNSTKENIEVKGKYTPIEELLPFAKALKDFISSKQYNMSANAKVYEKDTQIYSAQNMTLQMDLTGKLKFYANALVQGLSDTKAAGFNMNLSAFGGQSGVYVDYNSLSLKISQADFENLVEVALKLFNMDNFITPAKNLLNGNEITLDDIMSVLTSATGEISLSAINMLKRIDIENDVLRIAIDGSSLSSSAKAYQMEIALIINNGALSQISLKNFYTGVTENEHFDCDVYLHDFSGVASPSDEEKYIDFSGSSDLVEAILNTVTSYQTFEFSGYLNIKLKFGLIDIDWNLSFHLQIRFVDGKLEMQASVGIPVLDLLVYNLNNDTPWSNGLFTPLSIKNRILYIYYRDNYFYFYRQENNNSGDSYQKAMKAHVDSVLDDIIYYVQWGTGFNDEVIDAIREAGEISDNHTPNLSKVINGFSCPSQNGSDFFKLSLNLGEITGSNKMGDIIIGASVKQDKKIIGGLSFNIDMPLIWGTTLYLKSDLLSLTPGVNFNPSTIDLFANGFKRGKESIEYSALNGYWKRDGERLYTVKFNTGFDDIHEGSITGSVGTRFILPKYGDKVIGTKHEGMDYTVYSFKGWYTDKNFSSASKYTRGIIPAKNITIYGKWEIKEGYRTISYFSNGKLLLTDYALVGSPLRSDIARRYIEFEDNNILYRQEFVGWKDKNGVAVEVVPDESENLYAYYQTYQTLNKWTLHIEQGVGGAPLTKQVFETLELKNYLPSYNKIPVNENGKNLVYTFQGWFVDSEFKTPAPSVMPSSDLTLYAKWDCTDETNKLYHLRIYDNNTLYSAYCKEGTPLVFSKNVPIDSTTLWYIDSNYIFQTVRPTLMPANDLTLYIRNKYTVSYTYYTLENGTFTEKTYTKTLYQGSAFALQPLIDFEETVKVAGIPTKRIGYYFQGYRTIDGESITSNVLPNHDLTFSATYTTLSKNFYKLTFHTDWVEPGWWVKSGDEISDKRTINDMYVLEGSYIQGATLYSVVDLNGTIQQISLQVEVSRKYIGVRYSFGVAAWNTTKCKNLYDSAFGNGSSNKEIISIYSDTELYIEWKHL